MPLTVTAKLVDSQNKPLQGIIVQVVFYTANGAVSLRARGASEADGTVKIAVGDNLGTFLPRIGLRAQVGRMVRFLSDSPDRYTAAAADFGTLEVNTEQAVMTMGATVMYARPQAFAVAAAQPAAEEPALSRENVRLKRELEGATASVAGKERELQALRVNVEEMKRRADLAETAKKAAEEERERIRAQLGAAAARPEVSAVARDVELNDTVRRLHLDVKDLHGQLESARQKAAAAEQAKVALEAEKGRMEAQMQRTLSSTVAIDTLFDNTASKLDRAESTLREKSNRYSLGKVSLKLKVLPTAGGESVVLPDPETIARVGGANLSELTLDFHPPARRSGREESVPGVPAVVGYTRTLAERKLAEVQLRARWLEEQVTDPKRAGQVLRQDPPAGTALKAGDYVELILGVPAPTAGG